MTEQNALTLRDVTKCYAATTALDRVSLELPMGTILGLIGENGAGKTTLIKGIMGLIHLDGGEIVAPHLGGDPKTQAALVPDECPFHDLLTPRMVGQVLSGACPTWDSKYFHTLLERFSLPQEKLIKEFSRGMKMKLSLAAALARRPKILLLDEATGGLDPVVRDSILELLLDFVSDEAHAVLLSSHITSDLEKAADYVAYLHQGRILLHGSKDEVLEDHGLVTCSRSDLDTLDSAFVVGRRENAFQCQALIRNKARFRSAYPHLPVDPVSLEDIMVFTTGGATL